VCVCSHTQTDRQRERQRETERDRERQRETERDRERQRETERDRERQRERDRKAHPLLEGAPLGHGERVNLRANWNDVAVCVQPNTDREIDTERLR
jgi:sRNA-binding protein